MQSPLSPAPKRVEECHGGGKAAQTTGKMWDTCQRTPEFTAMPLETNVYSVTG